MIEDSSVQIDSRGQRMFHQMRMHGVASGVDVARDQYDITNFQALARIMASVSGGCRTISRPVRGNPSSCVIFSTGRDGSRYSHSVIAPLEASRRTPSLRYAQQS